MDAEAILNSVRKTKCVVTAEEHQIYGGLGESIAGLLAQKLPSPIEFVGVKDTFGESGPPSELMIKYGLDASNIIEAAEKVMTRRA